MQRNRKKPYNLPRTREALWVNVFGKKKDEKPIKRAKAISNTMRLMLEEYRKRKRKWFQKKKNRTCRGCGSTTKRLTVHHINGRTGALLNYEPWWAAVCLSCHQRIDRDRNWALEKGLLFRHTEWNRPPPQSQLLKFYGPKRR